MIRRFFLVLLACVLWLPAGAQGPTYCIVENIAYRDVECDVYAGSMCRLDVYYPMAEKGFATLVWFHGGGLTGGRREIPDALKNNGFAVVGVEYRLTPHVTVADCIDDAAAAAAWVVKHITRYGGDPAKIFVAGHSAGGYLTSMIGLDKRWMARYGLDPDTAFAALIPYSGQAITHFERRRELGMRNTQPLVDDYAPLFHVRADCPPVFILSGDREREMLGRYEENAYFWRMFRVAGHQSVQLKEFDGLDHSSMLEAGHCALVHYMCDFKYRTER